MRAFNSIQALSIAFCLPLASAFKNSSPFFLSSSSPLPPTLPRFSSSVDTVDSFLDTAKELISSCSAQSYVFVDQPSIHANDFEEGRPPHLFQRLYEDDGTHALFLPYTVPNNAELDAAEELEKFAKEKCDGETVKVDARIGTFPVFDNLKPKIVRVEFAPLPVNHKDMVAAIKDNDSFLHSILTMLPKGEVTLVYTSSPPTEVKPRKDQTIIRKGSEDVLRAVKRQEQPTNNSTQPGDNILANYVLFNQGVFLGYIGMFFFVVILYFGLSAITSLKITLGAFERADGNPDEKKQQ